MVYIALFSLLMTTMLVTVYSLIATSDRTINAIGVEEEGTFINRKIGWALTSATAVQSPSPDRLVITRPDMGAQSPITIAEIDGVMTIARGNSAAPVALTGTRFEVASTTFTVVPTHNGVPPAVHLSYKIDGTPFVYKTYLRI
jgi:hypothetical protein